TITKLPNYQINSVTISRGDHAFKYHINFSPFARSHKLHCRSTICRYLQISHAAEDSENLARRAIRIIRLHSRDFLLADRNLECRWRGLEEPRHVLRRDVGDQISEA